MDGASYSTSNATDFPGDIPGVTPAECDFASLGQTTSKSDN